MKTIKLLLVCMAIATVSCVHPNQVVAQTYHSGMLELNNTWLANNNFKYINVVRFPDQYSGSTGQLKQDAAIADIGAGPGMLFDTPALAAGCPSSYTNNISIFDFRQTTDFNANVCSNADRVAQLLIDSQLGDFSTRTLSGTFTITNGSTAVTGVGTHFTTELQAGGSGSLIKLNADGTTAWARVSAVADDTDLTLAANYTGTGGAGASSAAVTQNPFAVRDIVTGGTPPDMGSGEAVGITSIVGRETAGGLRGVYGANFNTFYKTAASATQGQAIGLEIDISNKSGADDTTGVPTYGLDVISAGTNHPNGGIAINGMTSGAAFRRGLVIFPNAYTEAGVDVIGAEDMVRAIPTTNNNSPAIGVRNSGDTTYLSALRNDGSAAFAITGTNPTVETIGTASSATGIAISGANTHDVTGAYGQAIVDPTNTQNWTDATPSFRGLIGQYHMSSGATGTVSNAAAVLGDIVVDAGTTTTNGYHFYALAHEGSGTLTNEFSYGAAPGAGMANIPDGFKSAGVALSSLGSAASGNAGEIHVISDSTSVSAEGQTCVGSSTNTALAFSDGTVWKCF